MCQEEASADLDQAVGYMLKQAATALRSAMDSALRPLGLTVPQYACLELLRQRPGLSNADLARGAFVSRQAMNGVLRGLQDRGLVSRPVTAARGRALPTQLTPAGHEQLHSASTTVHAIEQQMLSGLPVGARQRLRQDLASCIAALTPEAPSQPIGTDSPELAPSIVR